MVTELPAIQILRTGEDLLIASYSSLMTYTAISGNPEFVLLDTIRIGAIRELHVSETETVFMLNNRNLYRLSENRQPHFLYGPIDNFVLDANLLALYRMPERYGSDARVEFQSLDKLQLTFLSSFVPPFGGVFDMAMSNGVFAYSHGQLNFNDLRDDPVNGSYTLVDLSDTSIPEIRYSQPLVLGTAPSLTVINGQLVTYRGIGRNLRPLAENILDPELVQSLDVFYRYDLSDLELPQEIGFYVNVGGDVFYVSEQGVYVIASTLDSLELVFIPFGQGEEPKHYPIAIASEDLGEITDLLVVDNRAYIAAGRFGVLIREL